MVSMALNAVYGEWMRQMEELEGEEEERVRRRALLRELVEDVGDVYTSSEDYTLALLHSIPTILIELFTYS